MSRLVIVSNRVPNLHGPAVGGLAVALDQMLQQTGGLWFGWSGTVLEHDETSKGTVQTQYTDKIMLATLDLRREDHDSYYAGYSNEVLWPVFHSRLDLANFDSAFFEGYLRTNQTFAHELLPLLRKDDTIWVHDYHLIPLAAQLRALGCRQRIGFFLHIPLPPQVMLAAIPQHEWLVRSLFAYDMIGLQTQQDAQHFEDYVLNQAQGHSLGSDLYQAYGQNVRCSVFPIGIDADEFKALTHSSEAIETCESMKRKHGQQRIVLGIDRLDYSKGLSQRMHAFSDLLANYPENRGNVTMIQIASPTRENNGAYASIRSELESLSGAINGNYGELDWMPMRYIYQMVARKHVPGLCRAAAVGLVTPLRDGMNLVAKEYVVAQDPTDPGVLVLSRFAGAAEQLKEALLVNPYDVHGTAEAIQQALHMPLRERLARHHKLLQRVQDRDVHWWRKAYLSALENTSKLPD